MASRAVKAQTTTQGATICFTYGHAQNGISVVPTISFPGGVSVTITPASEIDSVSMNTFALYK